MKTAYVLRDLRSHRVELFSSVKKAVQYVKVNSGIDLIENDEARGKHEYYVNDYLAREEGRVVMLLDKMIIR